MAAESNVLHHDDWFIYSAPAMEPLARLFGPVRPITRQVFSDGSPNIKISGIGEIAEKAGGAWLLYFHGYQNLHEKKCEEMIIFVLAETLNVERLVIIDPFDPWATMERVTTEGEVASANCDAHFWKTLPLLQSGRKVLRLIYDQHTLQNRFFYQGGHSQMAYKSGVPVFLKHVETECGWKPDEHHAVAFPDEGACKRFGKAFPGYELIICAKKRQGDERVVTIMDGQCQGRKVVIVDDLVRSGGTLIECAKGLLDHGAVEVNCYVTHAEFPQESWKKFLPGVCPVPISNFWVTNTCIFTTEHISATPPFTVISLRDDIATFINNLRV